MSRGRQLAGHAPGTHPGIGNFEANYASNSRAYLSHGNYWNIWQFFATNQIPRDWVVACLPHTPPDTPPHHVDNGGVDHRHGSEIKPLYRLSECFCAVVTRFWKYVPVYKRFNAVVISIASMYLILLWLRTAQMRTKTR